MSYKKWADGLLQGLGYWKALPLWTALIALTGCGGGGGDGGAALRSAVQDPVYQVGNYSASSTYHNHCAAPRSGTSDVQGSATWENFWLRSWTHELYLWYNEVPDVNPSTQSDPLKYFKLMKTSAFTPSGSDKDRFHFTYPTEQWEALSQAGQSIGYGVTWTIVENAPPRVVIAAFTNPGSPATAANVTRGVRVLSVDGVDIVNDNTLTAWPEGLYPNGAGEPHTFSIQEINGTIHTVNMTSANITEMPVLNYQTPGIIQTGSGKVGYLIFNDHFATAESELVTAINTLEQAGVSDLVLDLRYNGGGYLDIASELAYMIAGSAYTSGRIFEQLSFNNQYSPAVNPVTGQANDPTPFHSTTQGFSLAAGSALPSLNLNHVFVITGTGTCSASESIINGLRGVNVQVTQIGSTTCGKPYGFYPKDNCGTTYFSIEFQGVNDAGDGNYGDGFSPWNTTSNPGVLVPGCSVADDFTHSLGDTSEGRLAAALFYRANSSCSGPATGNAGHMQIQSNTQGVDLSAVDGQLNKGAWRENRIMRQ